MVSAGLTPVGSYLSLVEGLKRDRRRPFVDAYAGRLETIDEDVVGNSEKGGLPGVGQKSAPPSGQGIGWQRFPEKVWNSRACGPPCSARWAEWAAPLKCWKQPGRSRTGILPIPSPLIIPGRCRRQPRGAGR